MPKKTTKTLADAASSGSRLEALKTLRDQLAKSLDSCESLRDQAALSLRFVSVLEQIESLEPSKKETAAERLKREAAQKKADEAL